MEKRLIKYRNVNNNLQISQQWKKTVVASLPICPIGKYSAYHIQQFYVKYVEMTITGIQV